MCEWEGLNDLVDTMKEVLCTMPEYPWHASIKVILVASTPSVHQIGSHKWLVPSVHQIGSHKWIVPSVHQLGSHKWLVPNVHQIGSYVSIQSGRVCIK